MDQYVRDPRLYERIGPPARPESSWDEDPTDQNARTLFPDAQLPVRPPPSRHTIATSPFNSSSSRDLTIRSSDLVDFCIRSPVLLEASRPLRDMVSALLDHTTGSNKRRRLSPDTVAKDIPTLCLAEHSSVVGHLLRLTYGFDDNPIPDAFELCDVLASAKKYKLGQATRRLVDQFATLANTEPARLYMLACRRGWEDCMRLAARASLTDHLSVERFAAYEDVSKGLFVTAPEHARLVAYHRRCSAAVSSLIGHVASAESTQPDHLTIRWLANDTWVWFRCTHRPGLTDKVKLRDGTLRDAARWWTTYLHKAQERLKERPGSATILDVKLWGWYAVSGVEHCPICKRQVLEDLYTFKDIFAREVDKIINTVELECNNKPTVNKPTVTLKRESSTPPLN